MPRGEKDAKPAKAKVEAELAAVRKLLKSEASRRRQLEKRLTEAQEQQTATAEVLQTRTRELDEALEQQRATSEILRVISSSPTNLRPVLETIAENAARVCGATDGVVHLVEGGELPLVAHYGLVGGTEGAPVQRFPVTRGSVVGRAVIDARAVHVEDAAASDEAEFPLAREIARQTGHRTILATPLLREGVAIGALVIRRPEVRPFANKQIALLQTFADQAVIAIENVRLFKELQARNLDLTEALNEKTATSEILRVISSSPIDIQPVLDVIAESAARLCEADLASVFRFDGTLIHHAAQHGRTSEEIESARRAFPQPPHRGSVTARALLAGSAVQIADVASDPEVEDSLRIFRTVLSVPMIRDGQPLGAITVARRVARPFTDGQIALLQTFADQAVIAIENVRLFRELEARNSDLTEALEQQTATSEILRIISSSPTDVQPVFDTIVASAVRLCHAHIGAVFQFDGEMLHLVAHHNFTPEMLDAVKSLHPRPPQRDMVSGRAIMSRAVVQIEDVLADREYHQDVALATSWRSMVAVPMLREGEPVGAIVINRVEPGPFADNHLELLQTFADQAVIAIENARLFTELQTSNRELTTALDTQTATSDILRVISQSQTDVQPVFDAILDSAVRLLRAYAGVLTRIKGDQIELAALTSTDEAGDAALRASYPQPLRSEEPVAQVIRDRRPLNIADYQTDPRVSEAVHARARARGFRSVVVVPMLRHDEAVGTIAVSRREPGGFNDDEIALLQTFADQAVIAIENVRLFTELEARNADLTEALEQQTATSELLKVIGGSTFDLQPVFETLAENAVRLCEAERAFIFRFDGQVLRGVASYNASPETIAFHEQNPIVPGRNSATARAAVERRTVHVHDAAADPEYTYASRQVSSFRTIIGIPMLRADELLGVITIYRPDVRPFADSQIALLETFADQAAIAIENVRLFNETKEALERQTATSEILQVISSSPTDIQPVLDTVAESAARLCEAFDVSIFRREDDRLRLVAHHGSIGYWVVGETTLPLIRGAVTGRTVLDARTVHVADLQIESDEFPEGSGIARQEGHRTVLSVPMMREGVAIGTIALRRTELQLFTDRQVALLQTFANQAVIAIENVRLFKELEARNRDLTATSEILQVISRSPTDLQPVFDTIADRSMRLCGAAFGWIMTFDGQLIHLRSLANVSPEGAEALRQNFPLPASRGFGAGRTILTGEVVEIPDVLVDPEYAVKDTAQVAKYRSILTVPLVHQARSIGVIAVSRPEPGAFSRDQIQLLQTFADQAVIAIENVRLFTELEGRNRDLTEALDQQTATSEILRVISQSQTDVQPVFDAIVVSAVRLLGAYSGVLTRIKNDQIELAALTSTNSAGDAAARALYPEPLQSERLTARAIRERAPLNVGDAHTDPRLPEEEHARARVRGYRSLVVVPMLRHDEALGTIAVTRREPGGFTDDEITLLQTFADQAVIAIENARLLSELRARTGELTQSVEQLTALGEVSRAVSSTLDVETVLDTIVSRASQLAGAAGCSIYEYDGTAQQFELRATYNDDTEFVEALRAVPLRKGEGLMGRAAEMREPIQIPDITQPGAYESSVRDTLIRFGYHALLSVPLLRENQIIGSLSFNRKAPGEFPREVVEVLKTFATQSALAIQNARLFREIADKSAQLEAASRHKSEFLANMSHELRTPLNAIIGFSEILAEKMFGDINEKQTEYLQDILESGRHLLSLINDILDLSKIEAGRMELELSEFHLPGAIDNALILVRERASRRGIKLGSSIDEQLGMIGGDERKVKQVLLNLLSNALKFTPEGGRIDVRARRDDGMAEISVADTGIGIAPADQDAVFEEFRQVGTADKKAEGTGLGLALSRKFIELHGGKIWVRSEVGRGSTFTFTLPVRS